jgi:hypothetical protein
MDSSAHYGSNSRPDRIWDWTDRGNQRGQAYAPGFCWIIHDPIGCERCILGAYIVRTQARVHTPIYLPKFETVIIGVLPVKSEERKTWIAFLMKTFMPSCHRARRSAWRALDERVNRPPVSP